MGVFEALSLLKKLKKVFDANTEAGKRLRALVPGGEGTLINLPEDFEARIRFDNVRYEISGVFVRKMLK